MQGDISRQLWLAVLTSMRQSERETLTVTPSLPLFLTSFSTDELSFVCLRRRQHIVHLRTRLQALLGHSNCTSRFPEV